MGIAVNMLTYVCCVIPAGKQKKEKKRKSKIKRVEKKFLNVFI